MANETEEITRRVLKTWNSSDWETEAQRQLAEEVVVVAPAGWPESGTFVGWEAWRRQITRLKEPWSEEHYGVASIETRGAVALAAGRWRGHGHASGLELDMETWTIFVLEGDKVVRMEFFLDAGAARARYEELADEAR